MNYMNTNNYVIVRPSAFCGLGTAIGCITYVSRKHGNALCVLTMRFLHLAVILPYQGYSLFVSTTMSKSVSYAGSHQLP